MRVLQPAAVHSRGDLRALQLVGLFRSKLCMEQRQHDLFADLGAELLEHDVALVAVLDERILLRHGA